MTIIPSIVADEDLVLFNPLNPGCSSSREIFIRNDSVVDLPFVLLLSDEVVRHAYLLRLNHLINISYLQTTFRLEDNSGVLKASEDTRVKVYFQPSTTGDHESKATLSLSNIPVSAAPPLRDPARLSIFSTESHAGSSLVVSQYHSNWEAGVISIEGECVPFEVFVVIICSIHHYSHTICIP